MPHHQLRSRVIRQRFVAAVVALNVIAAVIVGFIHKKTDADAILPYAAGLNAILIVAGIGIVIARRKVHGIRGVACDLTVAILVPILFFLILACGVIQMKSDVQ